MHRDVEKIFPGNGNAEPFTDLERQQIREAIHYIALFIIRIPVNMRRAGRLLLLGAVLGFFFHEKVVAQMVKMLGM